MSSSFISCSKKELPRQSDNNNSQNSGLSLDVKKYQFTRNGISSVDIGESKEVIMAFRHFNNAINNKVLGNFKTQYDNYNRILKDKIAPTLSQDKRDQITDSITGLIENLYKLVNSDAVNRHADENNAGYLSVSNEEQRLLDKNGVELGQVIQKVLMGALVLDRIMYFIQKTLDSNNNEIIVGTNYTEMEHNWDIAYGYLGTLDVDRNRLVPLFLANYIEKEAVGMSGLNDINVSVYNAFYYGREAISNKNIQNLKEQIKTIKNQMYKLFSLRTVYYLRECNLFLNKSTSTPSEGYFHSMGEALGFILALSFVKGNDGNNILSIKDSYDMYNGLINHDKGLWNRDMLIGSEKGSISNTIQKILQYFPN